MHRVTSTDVAFAHRVDDREIPQKPRAERRHIWLVGALVFTLIRALPNLSYPIARDQAVYCVLGRGLLEGKHLYIDYWDNRSPGLAYMYAAIVKVFGPVMWCVGAVDILWLLVISCFIFLFAERYLGSAGAAISVAAYVSWHVWAGYWQAAQAEPLMMTFIFAAFLLVARKDAWVKLRHIAAGVLLGGAFWTKYNGIVLMPVALLLPYIDFAGLDMRPRRIRLTIPRWQWLFRATLVGAGFLAVVGLVLMYFWHVRSLAEFWYQQFVVMPRYVAMAAERTEYLWLYGLLRTEIVLGMLTEAATVAALYIAWKQGDLARVAPILIAAALGYLAMAIQVRFHDYGFESCLPFFAMVWGYLCIKVYHRFSAMARACAERGWRVVRGLVWAVLVNIVAWFLPAEAIQIGVRYQGLATWWHGREASYSSYPWARPISHLPDQMRVVSHLEENGSRGEAVFVWGSEPLIYFLTGTCQPTRFVLNLPLISPWSPQEWLEEVVADLKRMPPRRFVVARDDALPEIAFHRLDSEEFLEFQPEFAIFLADYYEPERELEFFKIYRRRDLPGVISASASPSPCR